MYKQRISGRPDVLCWRCIALISMMICSVNVLLLLHSNGRFDNRHYHSNRREITRQSAEDVSDDDKIEESGVTMKKESGEVGGGRIPGERGRGVAGVASGLNKGALSNEVLIKNPLWLSLNIDQFFTPNITVLGKKRPKKSLVAFGIPTVKRSKAYYLLDTLDSMTKNLPAKHWPKVVIVVLVADDDSGYRDKVVRDVGTKFGRAVNDGLIQVIRTNETFYPNLNKVPRLYGDKANRVRWRSKQCLDYSFMFYYCADLADYYVQLEDDIVTEPHFFTKINKYLESKEKQQKSWSVIEFGARGFIGMTYRAVHLRSLSKFARFYFWTMPVDWIFRVFNEIFLYGNDKRHVRKPPLFKHVGKFSSLRGQTRKLEDLKQKGGPAGRKLDGAAPRAAPRPPAFKKHTRTSKIGNPPATITTTIPEHVKFHKIERAYTSSGFFWGKSVRNGSRIDIVLKTPTNVSRIVIRSGSRLYPLDSLRDTVLLVGYDAENACEKAVEVGRFQKSTIDITLNEKKPAHCVRLVIERTHVNDQGQPRWLIIGDIWLL